MPDAGQERPLLDGGGDAVLGGGDGGGGPRGNDDGLGPVRSPVGAAHAQVALAGVHGEAGRKVGRR